MDNRFGAALLGKYPNTPGHLRFRWQPLGKYLAEHTHPLWRKHSEEARKTGHGGGDYFVLRELYQMVRDNREPWIDVYDAAHWSSLYECTQRSLDDGNATIEIPDFTNGRWQDTEWRRGRLV